MVHAMPPRRQTDKSLSLLCFSQVARNSNASVLTNMVAGKAIPVEQVLTAADLLELKVTINGKRHQLPGFDLDAQDQVTQWDQTDYGVLTLGGYPRS